MKKHFGNPFMFLWIVLLLFLFIGCKRSEEKKPPVPPVVEKPGEFAITEPKNNGEVDQNIITVKGVGAQPGASITVEVFTDRWYLQNGEYEIRTDGSWTYDPCYLMASGNFRLHHNIRAKLMKDGNVLATSTIYDVIAPEPTK